MRSSFRQILIYGLSLAILLFLLKWLELRFIVYDYSMEIFVSAIALFFTGLGIWLALKLSRPKIQTVVVEREVIVNGDAEFKFNEEMFKELGLTQRELEVLQQMSNGLSNQEIADALFLSVPTIKTHASNLFEKLDVKRRTQAIEKGKSLKIIP